MRLAKVHRVMVQMVCIRLVVLTWEHILRAFSVVSQEITVVLTWEHILRAFSVVSQEITVVYIVVKAVQNCCEIKVKHVTIKLTAVKDFTCRVYLSPQNKGIAIDWTFESLIAKIITLWSPRESNWTRMQTSAKCPLLAHLH